MNRYMCDLNFLGTYIEASVLFLELGYDTSLGRLPRASGNALKQASLGRLLEAFDLWPPAWIQVQLAGATAATPLCDAFGSPPTAMAFGIVLRLLTLPRQHDRFSPEGKPRGYDSSKFSLTIITLHCLHSRLQI
jgi:hypothetical protein